MEPSFKNSLISESKKLLKKILLSALLLLGYCLMLIAYCHGMILLTTHYPEVRYVDTLGLLGLGYLLVSYFIHFTKIIDKE